MEWRTADQGWERETEEMGTKRNFAFPFFNTTSEDAATWKRHDLPKQGWREAAPHSELDPLFTTLSLSTLSLCLSRRNYLSIYIYLPIDFKTAGEILGMHTSPLVIFSQLSLLDMVRHKEVGGSTGKFARVTGRKSHAD